MTRNRRRGKKQKALVHKDDEDGDNGETSQQQDDLALANETSVEPGDGVVGDEVAVKASPILDVVVHRIRHLNYLPRSIVTIRSTPKHSKHALVAISRENGSVELRSVNEKFRTLVTVPGQVSKPVDAMAWVIENDEQEHNVSTDQTPRLVGASRDGSLFLVDFVSLKLAGLTPSGGGGVFVLNSLYENSTGDEKRGASLVAAGCEDGSIRIFQCTCGNLLTLFSTVPTMGAAVLSLAWRRMDKASSVNDSDVLMGTSIFAGVADGTIRKYTYQSAKSRAAASWKSGHRMTAESLGRKTPTRIWSLKLLQDWTLVSSDSLGHVQFWDGKNGSLSYTFQQTDQKSDVLDIAVSSDETKVFASGVDSRVVCMERTEQFVGDPSNTANHHRWILTHAHRPHTHDVKALAVCFHEKSDQTIVEVLCSGGVDMKFCTYSVKSFPISRPRTIYPWPAQTPIMVAPKARFIAIVKETRAEVHLLGDYDGIATKIVPTSEKQTLLGVVEVKTQNNLICGAISDDGRIMILCDAYSVYVLKLLRGKGGFEPIRIPFEDNPKSSISAVLFAGNGLFLMATHDGQIHVLEVELGNDETGRDCVKTKQTISSSRLGLPSSSEFLPVHTMSSSCYGKCIATICNTFRGSVVDVYVRDEDNSYRHWWTLPRLQSAVTTISFLAKSESRLAVACVDFELYIFDVRQRELDPWSAQGGNSVTVPTELSTRNDYPLRICAHPSCHDSILLGAYGVFLVVDLSKSPPSRCRTVPEDHVRRKKRSRTYSTEGLDTAGTEAVQCLRYNSILFMGFTGDSEIIVVEQPWLSVMEKLPDALKRKIYGVG